MSLINPIEILKRCDKWYLGNGGMLIYAPPFPVHLDVPGFWDECHWGDISISRLLCLSFALESNNSLVELKPVLTNWRWFPDRIEADYELSISKGIGNYVPSGLCLREKRMVTPDSTLICEIEIVRKRKTKTSSNDGVIHVIAWTARQKGRGDSPEKHDEFRLDDNSLRYTQHCARRAHGRGEKPVALYVAMSSEPHADSFEVTPGHGANLLPVLSYTPFWDSLKNGKLSGNINGDNVLGSVTWAGMHWTRKISGSNSFKLQIQVNVSGLGVVAQTSCLYDNSDNPHNSWREFLSLVPHFQSSDKMLTRYYWYRWYGIQLNSVPKGGNYVAPAVTEGIAYFRGVITYSLMCHLYECKWMSDPELAMGCLRNHIAHQTDKGHFPGHIYVSHVNKDGFYHTDVGRAVRELIAHHPDTNFIHEIYHPLKRLLNFYLKERDKEGLGLYDILDQFETGQEYTSRYFHADNRADLYGWEHKIRLKGADVTTYVYHLAHILEECSTIVGKSRDATEYAALMDKIKRSVRENMWDESRSFFFDYNPETKRRSPYWAAIGFYPLLSDLATEEMALAVAHHLEDPGKFATSYPTPTVSVDDKYFSPDALWRNERANCPWNGRVWPMVNSHIVEVIAHLAEINPDKYRPMLVSYLRRFIEMMHYEKDNRRGAGKDLNRPNCFEHYNPYDGTASEYRGIDDYMHSWIVDLILKYVTGVRVNGSKLIIDPFPFKLRNFLMTNLKIRGKKIDICFGMDRAGRESEGYKIYIDDVLEFRDKKVTRWEVEL